MPLDSNVVEYLAQPVPGSELEDPMFDDFSAKKKMDRKIKEESQSVTKAMYIFLRQQ